MVAAMNLKHIALLVLTTLLSVSQVCAQQYLRIGTGGTAGTYYQWVSGSPRFQCNK
jgi:TRAP-type uncharacterized transport system substrate-binding protein